MSTRNVFTGLASAALALALIASTSTTAIAASSSPEGGRWNHGVRSGGTYGSGGQVYSFYNHPSRVHTATACNIEKCTKTLRTAPGSSANAILSPASFGRNTAFYGF